MQAHLPPPIHRNNHAMIIHVNSLLIIRIALVIINDCLYFNKIQHSFYFLSGMRFRRFRTEKKIKTMIVLCTLNRLTITKTLLNEIIKPYSILSQDKSILPLSIHPPVTFSFPRNQPHTT